jgi:hypothetical protein
MHEQNTQFPRDTQPSLDYVRTTLQYAMDTLRLGSCEANEFLQVDLELDWFAAKPARINRDPERYRALQKRYAELNRMPVHFNRIAA